MIRLKPTLTCILIIYFIDSILGFALIPLDDGYRPQRENKLSLLVRLIPRDYETLQFEYDRKKPQRVNSGISTNKDYLMKKLISQVYKTPQFVYDRKKPERVNPRISTNKEYLMKKWISQGYKTPQFEYDRQQKHQRNPVISTNEVSLVKRLVPRGYKTPQFEYDRKFKSVFVPKHRVHKRRPVNNGKVFTELYELFFKPMFYKSHGALSELARQIGRHILRADTVYDPVGSNSKKPLQVVVNGNKSKQAFNFPHFSLFDTWTVDQALFHDQCPPHQAQVGNHCIYAPMASVN